MLNALSGCALPEIISWLRHWVHLRLFRCSSNCSIPVQFCAQHWACRHSLYSIQRHTATRIATAWVQFAKHWSGECFANCMDESNL